MRKSILILAALVVASCTLMISAGMAGRSVVETYPIMLGLPGVHVKVVSTVPKKLLEHSRTLAQTHLRATVESVLRKRNIRVFSEGDLRVVPGRPTLQVELKCAVDEELGAAAISVRFRLIEDTSLIRNDRVALRAETWARPAVTIVKFNELDSISEYVEKRTVYFCNLYDAANYDGVKAKPGTEPKG